MVIVYSMHKALAWCFFFFLAFFFVVVVASAQKVNFIVCFCFSARFIFFGNKNLSWNLMVCFDSSLRSCDNPIHGESP